MTTPATLPNFTDAIQERAVLAAGISNASERFRYMRKSYENGTYSKILIQYIKLEVFVCTKKTVRVGKDR